MSAPHPPSPVHSCSQCIQNMHTEWVLMAHISPLVSALPHPLTLLMHTGDAHQVNPYCKRFTFGVCSSPSFDTPDAYRRCAPGESLLQTFHFWCLLPHCPLPAQLPHHIAVYYYGRCTPRRSLVSSVFFLLCVSTILPRSDISPYPSSISSPPPPSALAPQPSPLKAACLETIAEGRYVGMWFTL